MRQFSLDMIPGGAQTAVACNQYESGDTWVFALYYDGGRYSIPADAEVSITGTKPDGAAYKVAGTVVDNAVVIEVTGQMTACAGRSIAEILVESETDGTTLYSANFPLLVEPAAVQGEFSPSEIPSAIVDTDGNVYYSAEYIPEVSGGVPTEVRQAMLTLFEKAAYIEEGLADEVAVITAWAEATTGITVSPASASVSSASPTAQLSAVTTPAGGAVTWASSNTAVATVSSTGLVTAVGNGTATITATSGAVSASCAVTVTGYSMRSITNTLTNCTTDNQAVQVTDGGSYSATLTPETGRKFGPGAVTVTMGGTDITATAYNNGSISIAEVTGNIVISAYANQFVIDVIKGATLYDASLGFRYGFDNTTINSRRTMNPLALKLVNGRTYTFSIGELWGDYLCGVRVHSGSAETIAATNFAVEQGTKKSFPEVTTEVYASTYLEADETYVCNGDGQVFAVTIKNAGNSAMSDSDTAALLAAISLTESITT